MHVAKTHLVSAYASPQACPAARAVMQKLLVLIDESLAKTDKSA